MKFLAKLLFVTGTLVLSGLAFSSIFDDVAESGAFLQTGAAGGEWQGQIGVKLENYGIKVDEISGSVGNNQYPYWVSGRALCQYVFIFQYNAKDKNGNSLGFHDLIFANKGLAQEFVTSIQGQRLGEGPDGKNIYARYTRGGLKSVVAVGYKTDLTNAATKDGHKRDIRFLYLKYDDHTAENYACSGSPYPFTEGTTILSHQTPHIARY